MQVSESYSDLNTNISYNNGIESHEYDEYDVNKHILSVFWKGGKLGAAVYFMDSAEIQLVNDIVDIRPDFQICQHLFHEIQPTTVISCKTVSAIFLDQIKWFINNSSNENEPQIKLELLNSRVFNYEACRKRVLDIKIVNKSVNLLVENQATFVQSLINFDYQKMIAALGALLFYLDTTISRISLHMPSENILSIKILKLENLVWMDQETYVALEIFASAIHPSTFKWTTVGMKEDFSVHSLLNRCSSKLGSSYMRILLSHPTKDIATLKNRHEVIEFFLKPENEMVLKNIQDCLRHIFNISTIILQIIGTQATPTQWKRLYKVMTFVTNYYQINFSIISKTINHSIMVGEICNSHKNSVKYFEEIGNSLEESLCTIKHLIESLMDFEASDDQGRFVVKAGSIPELDEVKEKHKNVPRIMETVAQQELERLPQEIPNCSLIYFPEIGYLLGIPVWKPELKEEDLILPNMVFKFMLNNVAHYKTARCEEMDNILGDNHLIILKHETEIMYQLVEYIRQNVFAITTILDKIKLLDCLISFSIIAKEFCLVKPNLVTDHQMSIVKGRHILLQLCVNTFMPNDCYSSMEDSLIKIFTGPNSSGKSVYLKQVALIVYLAHVGSFVPAESATIGLVDYIHTRIQATESISTELSSFTLDLRQMYTALYNSTPNTLIVIDEFGKGTADVDGLSLLSACIQHFANRNENCPHVLISTHFHSLLSLLPQSPLIKPQTLDFLLDNEDVTYLYKVKDGFVSSSFAINAAKNVGVSYQIINRAKEVLENMQSGTDIKPMPTNGRTLLIKRRENCLKQIMTKRKEKPQDLLEIINLLDDSRL